MARTGLWLLTLVVGLVALAAAGAWTPRHRLDVLALGRDTAVGRGLDHARPMLLVLVLVAVLVSVLTALVGHLPSSASSSARSLKLPTRACRSRSDASSAAT